MKGGLKLVTARGNIACVYVADGLVSHVATLLSLTWQRRTTYPAIVGYPRPPLATRDACILLPLHWYYFDNHLAWQAVKLTSHQTWVCLETFHATQLNIS